MITTDFAIKYKNLYQEVEIMIENIGEIGFEVNNYKQELRNIEKKVNNNISNNFVSNFAKASYESFYCDGIKELNKIKNELDKYNTYFKIFNSCNYVNTSIQTKDIASDSLNNYVSEMIYNLKQIIKSDTMNYNNEKHFVEKVYETAYNLIKVEIINTGESRLYTFCKTNEINTSYFNKIIRKELDSINLNDEKKKKKKIKYYEIMKQGIESDCFDLDIIKYILLCTNEYNVDNCLNRISDDINVYGSKIKKSDAERLISRKGYIISNLKEYRKDIRKCIASLAFVSTLLSGFGLVKPAAKSFAMDDLYTRKTLIYSTVTDEETSLTEDIFWTENDAPSNRTVIKVYPQYNGENKRFYNMYDVSNYQFDNAKDYYDYGLDNYKTTPVTKEHKSDKEIIFDYDGGYTVVYKESYEYVGNRFDNLSFGSNITGIATLYAILLLLIDLVYFTCTERSILIGNIKRLKECLDSLAQDKLSYDEINTKINESISSVMNDINKYEELKDKFNELYEKNNYLLNDIDSLMEKYIQVTSNDDYAVKVRKLVEDYKSK